ncbi:DUF6473 family protein, partial [Actibacterium mucosum]|uniref:DUF6473 family protein n=1 Tax=Actibacterium mucosum TaxID=1087332 RepID=UPI00055167A3
MYEHLGTGALDYAPCRYGTSKLLFRGPKQPTNGKYCTVLGGVEVYGRFIEVPFTEVLQRRLNMPVLNLGCVNAGLDAFLKDEAVLDLARNSVLPVIQTLGAQNMSNMYYTVHPRRNDRFVRANDALKVLLPRVDFTEFNFTRHMLRGIRKASREAFDVVVAQVRRDWVAGMRDLGERLDGRALLLHVGVDKKLRSTYGPMGPDPLFVTGEMLASVRDCFADLLVVKLDAEAVRPSRRGKVYSRLEEHVAMQFPGPRVHEVI